MTSGDIRVGDEFEIRLTVADRMDAVEEFHCVVPGEAVWFKIRRSTLLAGRRIERPLQVGDRVYTNNADPNRRGTIKALDGDEAWVRWDDDIPGNITEETRYLTPAPASEGGGT